MSGLLALKNSWVDYEIRRDRSYIFLPTYPVLIKKKRAKSSSNVFDPMFGFLLFKHFEFQRNRQARLIFTRLGKINIFIRKMGVEGEEEKNREI